MSREEKTLRKLNEIVCSYNQSHKTILINRSLMEMFVDYMIEELDKAREEVLLELLEKKTNYKIERVDRGYKVTQEYVLVSDIEKELSKLNK